MAIIFILGFYLKKSNSNVSTIIADSPIVGFATGVLVVLNGISSLASSLPNNILSVISVIETTKGMGISPGGSVARMISQTVTTNALSIVIILCQIAFGVYLIKVYKKRIK